MNWFLIIVAVVVLLLSLVASTYILVNYMHPDDKNQAWFPKIVVIVGLTLSIITVLAFPLDIGNSRACNQDDVLSSCNYTLPMEFIWYIIFIVNCIVVFAIVPFTLFYYEADEDTSAGKRITIGLVWGLGFLLIFGLVFGIIYGLAGYVEYDVVQLESGLFAVGNVKGFTSLGDFLAEQEGCINPGAATANPNAAFGTDTNACDGVNGTELTTETWEVRTSFPIYIMAAASILGWVTFIVFGSFGLVALPLDFIRDFFSRPRSTITKSEYLRRAKQVGDDAGKIRDIASELKQQERSGGRTRKWRQQMKALTQQMLHLEEEEQQLLKVFPQGEDRDTSWGMYIISFYLRLVMGFVFLIVAVAWLVHIVVYMLPDPPMSPVLNAAFEALDDVFPLFGVLFFALFCGYLILAAIKGHIKLGVTPLTIFNAYPMRVGGTLMSAFLVNVALMMLSSMAVLQFCTQAFAGYAADTAVGNIFGQQISHIRGVRYLFTLNIFIYIFLGMAALGTLGYFVLGARKWKRQDKMSAYEV